MPVVIFESSDERERFVAEIEGMPVQVEERHEFRIGRGDPQIRDKDREIIAFTRAVMERLEQWRNGA